MDNKNRCEEMLFRNWNRYQCRKTAKVQREGKWYCTIHDPIRIKEKSEQRDEKWNEEWRIKQEKQDYEDFAVQYCKSQELSLQQLKDLLDKLNEGETK